MYLIRDQNDDFLAISSMTEALLTLEREFTGIWDVLIPGVLF